MNQSRDLRERVVRALAKVGLVWALAVLGALFMVMSSQSQQTAGSSTAPSTAGLVLALGVLAGGAAREPRGPRRVAEPDPQDVVDVPLALGLVFGGSTLA